MKIIVREEKMHDNSGSVRGFNFVECWLKCTSVAEVVENRHRRAQPCRWYASQYTRSSVYDHLYVPLYAAADVNLQHKSDRLLNVGGDES